ncbi:hypothetical protein JAAARDRAFT_333755 [Jaapia argillacea MUCL 33604]|uniref:Uncharacterized protein n=1 Tax=Jaapia argillacea MUCL 33604 TaxID=933084 RepID=A0A067PKB4_9AGAM|nr:hypothetical protein JAAARDRAFT_333755 [Jaapia argillacea MUCL 33604]
MIPAPHPPFPPNLHRREEMRSSQPSIQSCKGINSPAEQNSRFARRRYGYEYIESPPKHAKTHRQNGCSRVYPRDTNTSDRTHHSLNPPWCWATSFPAN